MKVYIVHISHEPRLIGVYFSQEIALEAAHQLTEYNAVPDGYFWVKEYEVQQ